MTKDFTGNVNVSGSLMVAHGTWKKAEEEQKIKRRSILPGYPINEAFKNIEEIDQYLSGDKITCLLCGKQYKSLGPHLKVHNYDDERYREKYLIPSNTGLVGTNTSKLLTNNAVNMLQSGKWTREQQSINAKNSKGKTRRTVNYRSVKQLVRYDSVREIFERGRISRIERYKVRTHCNKGHLLKTVGRKRCEECSRENVRKRKGHLPQEIALSTIIDRPCSRCGNITQCTHKAGLKRKVICDGCKKAYMRNYDANRYTDERRRRSREWYHKRKANPHIDTKPESLP